MTLRVRPSAVAGTFYPARPGALARTVDELLATADGTALTPKALVVPHAGYVYSGPVAASAYGRLAPLRETVSRVVLAGPAHRSHVDGLAVPSVDAFRTPLGDVEIDRDARAIVASLPRVTIDDAPHREEHSLEVHLPILQHVFAAFRVLPLVVGRASPEDIADVFDAVWGGSETFIVVSSDLSHYEDHVSAVAHDRRTLEAILESRPDAIGPYDACGAAPVRGLMVAATRHHMQPVLLDHRTSGDTAGPRDRVVGYAAIAYAQQA
jgi:AmmeMemoRadiSam system protein B